MFLLPEKAVFDSLVLFPLGVLLVSLLALYKPEVFMPLKSLIIPLLSVIMFGMGLNLEWSDCLKLTSQLRECCIGILLQFSIMPLLAFLLCYASDVPTPVMAGFVLLGACPGGTASNVMCYLSRGNLALSLLMTCCSTILAVVLTPILTWFFIGQRVDVPVIDMMMNILTIIFLPVSLGLFINNLFGARVKQLNQIFPKMSMVAIVMIIGTIIALNQNNLEQFSALIILLVMMHNLLGFLIAYLMCKQLRFSTANCRTIAIEVAMQNSGLAVALAMKFLTPLASLPAALFSVWHNISMGIIANYWRQTTSNSNI